MGTWGTGPFDSDAAEDYVDGLERLPAAQRTAVLARTFRRAIEAGGSERNPGEVIAAAAVVAANMPSGATLSWNEDYEGISELLIRPISAEFARSAVQALDAALPADGWVWRSWVSDDDRHESEAMVNALKAALNA